MWPAFFHPIWRAMHLTMRALPRDQLSNIERTQAIDYLRTQMPLVPCGGCAMKAVMYYAKNPPTGTTGDEFFKWTVDFHNQVNRELGKRVYSVEEAEKELNETMTVEYRALLRDSQRQRIDHAKIIALQDEVNLFRAIPHSTSNDSLLRFVLASIVLVVAILFLLITLFAVVMKKLARLQSAIVQNQIFLDAK